MYSVCFARVSGFGDGKFIAFDKKNSREKKTQFLHFQAVLRRKNTSSQHKSKHAEAFLNRQINIKHISALKSLRVDRCLVQNYRRLLCRKQEQILKDSELIHFFTSWIWDIRPECRKISKIDCLTACRLYSVCVGCMCVFVCVFPFRLQTCASVFSDAASRVSPAVTQCLAPERHPIITSSRFRRRCHGVASGGDDEQREKNK